MPGPEPINPRAHCESWGIGDLAVCINDKWVTPTQHDPHVGEIVRVSHVEDVGMLQNGIRGIWLRFEGKPTNQQWFAGAFRHASRDDTPADPDFVAAIRGLGLPRTSA